MAMKIADIFECKNILFSCKIFNIISQNLKMLFQGWIIAIMELIPFIHDTISMILFLFVSTGFPQLCYKGISYHVDNNF